MMRTSTAVVYAVSLLGLHPCLAENPINLDPHAVFIQHVNLAVDPLGQYVCVVYAKASEPRDRKPVWLYSARSLDGGATFREARIHPSCSTGDKVWSRRPQIRFDGNRGLHVLWNMRQNERSPVYSRSADGGSSWTSCRDIGGGTRPYNYGMALGVSASGDRLSALYFDDDTHVYASESADGGDSWSLDRWICNTEWQNPNDTEGQNPTQGSFVGGGWLDQRTSGAGAGNFYASCLLFNEWDVMTLAVYVFEPDGAKRKWSDSLDGSHITMANDHTVLTDEHGRVWVVWGQDDSILLRRSADQGMHFQKTITIATPRTGRAGTPAKGARPVIARTTAGVYYVAWEDTRSGHAQIYMASSTEGTIWSDAVAVWPSAFDQTQLAMVTVNNVLYFCWIEKNSPWFYRLATDATETLPTGQTVDRSNLLPNPGFEESTGPVPKGWLIDPSGPAIFGAVRPGRNGQGACLAWDLQSENATITLAGPPIAAKADTPYVFMGHYASECNDIECRIDWQDDAGRVLASKRWTLPETQGRWIEFFEDITSPADPLTSPSSVKTFQIHIAHGGTIGQVRLDDFSLRQGELRDFPEDIWLPRLPDGAKDFPIFGWMEPALWNHFMDFYDRGTEYDLDRYHAEFAMAGFTVGRQARFGLRRYVTPYPESDEDLMESETDSNVIWISASNDEPWPHEFATLAEQNERVLEYAPSKPLWANLLPTYGFAFYESYQVYIDYIRGYIETVHPTFFTFDHYPFALYDDVRPDFFPNLEIVRDETRSASIDFGVIALVHQANETRRNLEEHELKWQAYSCLAYGAKALGWFTYFTHTDYAERVGGPGGSVIDWYGNRRRQYSMLKRIHGEIRMLGDTLLDLQSTGVFHTDPLPHMTHPVSESDWIETVAGDECILGEFRHSSGHRYLMVVNRDLLGHREYRVTFRTPHASAAEVSKTTGSLIELGNDQFDGQTLTVLLASGDGRLFRIE